MTMDTSRVHAAKDIRSQAAGQAAAGTRAPVPPVVVPRRRIYRNRALAWLHRFGALGALIILVMVATITSPNFLSPDNLRLQLQTFCLATALIGVGQTLVILTGGIDLSVGALLAVGSCLAGQMINNNAPMALAFAAPILLATVLGGVSGTIIARARIQPI